MLGHLQLLRAVQRRFLQATRACVWHKGAGCRAQRLERWRCFTEALSQELEAHGLDGKKLRFEAYVPMHFLLGRRLVTPVFDCSAHGLECGRRAWELLYGPLERRSEAPEAWQELQRVYGSVCSAAGHSPRRQASKLLLLQRDVRKRSFKRPRAPQDPEAKILKLLERWRRPRRSR